MAVFYLGFQPRQLFAPAILCKNPNLHLDNGEIKSNFAYAKINALVNNHNVWFRRDDKLPKTKIKATVPPLCGAVSFQKKSL